MKKFRTIAIIALIIGIIFSTTSCMVMPKRVNGAPKGFHKNSNNPHHFRSTNPGKSIGHSKK